MAARRLTRSSNWRATGWAAGGCGAGGCGAGSPRPGGWVVVRTKPTGLAPAAVAGTRYCPRVALATDVTLAFAPVMVAWAAEREAAGPLTGVTAKLTMPPSTGSTELMAVTVTASELAKLVLIGVDWKALEASSLRMNP